MAGHYPCTLQATNTRCGRRPGHPRVPSRLSAPREANLRLSGLRLAMPCPFVQSVLSRRQPPPKQRTLCSRRGQRSPQRADSGNGPAAPLLPRGLASRTAVIPIRAIDHDTRFPNSIVDAIIAGIGIEIVEVVPPQPDSIRIGLSVGTCRAPRRAARRAGAGRAWRPHRTRGPAGEARKGTSGTARLASRVANSGGRGGAKRLEALNELRRRWRRASARRIPALRPRQGQEVFRTFEIPKREG